jgi:hypothetical protein
VGSIPGLLATGLLLLVVLVAVLLAAMLSCMSA